MVDRSEKRGIWMSSFPRQPTFCSKRWAMTPSPLAAGRNVSANAPPIPAIATSTRTNRSAGGESRNRGRGADGSSVAIARVRPGYDGLRRQVGSDVLEAGEIVDVERELRHERQWDVGVPAGERVRRGRLPLLDRRKALRHLQACGNRSILRAAAGERCANLV